MASVDNQDVDARERKRRQNREAQKTYRQKLKRRIEDLEKWRDVAVAGTGVPVDAFSHDNHFSLPTPPNSLNDPKRRKMNSPSTALATASVAPEQFYPSPWRSPVEKEKQPHESHQFSLDFLDGTASLLMGSPSLKGDYALGSTEDSSGTHSLGRGAPEASGDTGSNEFSIVSTGSSSHSNTLKTPSEAPILPNSDVRHGVSPLSSESSRAPPSDSNCAPFGATALHLAAERGNVAIVNALLRRQVDANIRDALGRTALHLAAGNNHANLARSLCGTSGSGVNGGACVNAQDHYGRTPLHVAVAAGHIESIGVLLSVPGIGVDIKDQDGRTALHDAVISGSEGIIEALLEAGADVLLHVG